MTDKYWQIYTDGGSRGNPGPSACAFIIYNPQQQVISSHGFFLGIGTNNNAEYWGVLKALQSLSLLTNVPTQLNFYLDSELVVKQLSGLYKIKDQNLQSLANDIKKQFFQHSITFTHIPRSQNSAADLLVNQTLDSI